MPHMHKVQHQSHHASITFLQHRRGNCPCLHAKHRRCPDALLRMCSATVGRSGAADLDVGVPRVAHGHDGAILGPGGHLQLLGAAALVDDQAVVSRRLEGVVQALHQRFSDPLRRRALQIRQPSMEQSLTADVVQMNQSDPACALQTSACCGAEQLS